MFNQPLVSIVMIIYNAEKFLRDAIDSVFSQTSDKWELLLVDDGSTDGSAEIAQEYCEANPETVHYFEHEGHQNRGMSASRNLGIRNAKGSFVALLDADDVWMPKTLEEQVEALESHPEAAMVYGPTLWWYSWSGKPEDQQLDFVQPLRVEPDTLIRPPALLTVFLLQEGSKPCGMLMRRGIVEEVGGFEEAFRGMYEDQVFCAKLCLKAPVYVSSTCWYKYRQHPDSCCSTAVRMEQHHSKRGRFLNWLETYLSEKRVQNTELWQALRKELWPYRHPSMHRLYGYTSYFFQTLKEIF